PLGEIGDFTVGPHPGGPSLEGVQDVAGVVAGVGVALCVTIDAVAIGPVALDGDERESVFLDESSRERRAPLVELGCPMGGFAKEDVAGFADALDERVEVRVT